MRPRRSVAMKYTVLLIFLSLLILSGCAQTISTYGLDSIESSPNAAYTMYRYSSGSADRNRAVLVKSPDSNVEIVPYSVQIVTVQDTMENAFSFAGRGRPFQHISIQGVMYKGKTIGYLLVPEKRIFSRDAIDVNLFERNGKVYFSVHERIYD
jgi:hypothetical protein